MIYIKSKKEIDIIRRAGKILAEFLDSYIAEYIVEGVSTYELDTIAEAFLNSKGAKPSFKHYVVNGLIYPASICSSVNEQVVHGIPNIDIKLKNGDIIGIDIGANLLGYHADAARTYTVGSISKEIQKLVDVTKESLNLAIKAAKIGNRLGDISNAVQSYVEANGFSVVRDYCGHGIGKELHEDPQLLNFGEPGTGIILEEGLVLAIEPMINAGSYETKVLRNGWTVVTVDGSRSAHFEDTIAITKDGTEILTRMDDIWMNKEVG